jgi:AmmeMemoRadiSam system protein B
MCGSPLLDRWAPRKLDTLGLVASASSRPRLRPIETIIVPDRSLGRALMLRDTQGVTSEHAVLPMELVPVVARFTGAHTCEEIARLVSKETGESVSVELVVKLANELEEALFVEGAPYRRERARIEREFADADVRPASHAGGAYHGEPDKLAEYIETDCFARALGHASASASASIPEAGRLRGLIAPHIDPWRGALCYGEAYGVLAKALPPEADTFVLFGTSHAPMREPFSLCRKAFATPLGHLEADLASIDAIASACDFDPYADQLNHKREHSLEFQAVFLRHLLGSRKARIIPILAGLGEHQSRGESPSGARSVERFLDAVRKVVDAKSAVVIAGADLAHVGPRFGDPRAFDEGERAALHETDRESLDHATRGDAEGFWRHVSGDLETRRVCGLAPIYSLLRTISPGTRGHLRHYEQNVDPDEGSIVSHAALGFYG